MDTAIFRVSEFTINSFIYCCLKFYTLKRTCSIKSLINRGSFHLPLKVWFCTGLFSGKPHFKHFFAAFNQVGRHTDFNPFQSRHFSVEVEWWRVELDYRDL